MTDPVVGPDGITYERSAILQWLERNEVSPVTRVPMRADQLAPNFALRDAIEMLRVKHGPSLSRTPSAAVIASPPMPATALEVEATHNVALVNGQAVAEITVAIAPDAALDLSVYRKDCIVVFLLDISESMGEAATLPELTAEASNITRLDLVVHTVRTIIHMLSPRDRIAIITFNDRAATVLPPTSISAAGKAMATAALERLVPSGGTNIWDALRLALQLCDEDAKARAGDASPAAPAHTTMVLLTDGQPSITPPRGTLQTFENLTRAREKSFTLHSFGYGYGLQQGLLPGLAKAGRGSYAYIPDATMLGTVFVNFLAHLLSTAHPNTHVDVTATRGTVALLGTRGPGSKTLSLDLGALCVDQPRTLCLQLSEDAEVSITVSAGPHKLAPLQLAASAAAAGGVLETLPALRRAWARSGVVGGMTEALALALRGDHAAAHAIVAGLAQGLQTHVGEDECIAALYEDLVDADPAKGQMGKAVASADWFRQWGQHYLPAVLRAHDLQACMNFKDAGLQHYGGACFRALQAQAEVLFCELPAPVHRQASRPVPGRDDDAPHTRGSGHRSQAPSMSQYYNVGGG